MVISFSLIRVKIEAGNELISLYPLVHYLSRARLNVENQWRWYTFRTFENKYSR